jgi:hypothetical protein
MTKETVMTNANLDGGEPLVLDSRQLSQLLGIGRTKAYQMMARGDVPVIRIGRCVRGASGGAGELDR